MPSDDTNTDTISRVDGSVAAYVHVLCEGCNTYLPGEQNSRRDCPRCNVTVDVGCDVEILETDHSNSATMTQTTNSQADVPVTINPNLLCHACSRFMDKTRNGIWKCPGCSVRATVQCHAEVIDDDA